jgi:hypothetical protein
MQQGLNGRAGEVEGEGRMGEEKRGEGEGEGESGDCQLSIANWFLTLF